MQEASGARATRERSGVPFVGAGLLLLQPAGYNCPNGSDACWHCYCRNEYWYGVTAGN
jgi:hypothetical protein